MNKDIESLAEYICESTNIMTARIINTLVVYFNLDYNNPTDMKLLHAALDSIEYTLNHTPYEVFTRFGWEDSTYMSDYLKEIINGKNGYKSY